MVCEAGSPRHTQSKSSPHTWELVICAKGTVFSCCLKRTWKSSTKFRHCRPRNELIFTCETFIKLPYFICHIYWAEAIMYIFFFYLAAWEFVPLEYIFINVYILITLITAHFVSNNLNLYIKLFVFFVMYFVNIVLYWIFFYARYNYL